MSKLIDFIHNLNNTSQNSIGFASNDNNRQNSQMILMGYLDLEREYDKNILDNFDAILMKNWKPGKSFRSLESSKTILGIEIIDKSVGNLKVLEEIGIDFVNFGFDEINADILLSEKFSKGYSVDNSISDDKGASVEEVGFDFFIIKDESVSFPLILSDLLKIEETVLKISGNIIMYSNSLPGYSDLELLRKSQICGIIVDGNRIAKRQIDDLKINISRLKPLKAQPNSNSMAILPDIRNEQDFEDYE